MHEYDFTTELSRTQRDSSDLVVKDLLLKMFPGATSARSTTLIEDRSGIDISLLYGKRELSFDVKFRDLDPVDRYGIDDLALETWSVVETSKVGWTRDSSKRSDYVLWYFTSSGRWALLPFPLLCTIFSENWQKWRNQYRHAVQESNKGEWHSECVFVPQQVIWDAILARFTGRQSHGTEWMTR